MYFLRVCLDIRPFELDTSKGEEMGFVFHVLMTSDLSDLLSGPAVTTSRTGSQECLRNA